LNLANHFRTPLNQKRRIADELDGVAESLFGVQQNGLAANRRIAEP